MKSNKQVSFKKKPKWKIEFDFFNYFVGFSIYKSNSNKIIWKDKFNTPRVENVPFLYIYLGFVIIYIFRGTEEEWERYLWIHEYCNGDEIEAIRTWKWYDDINDKNNNWFNYKTKE